VRWFLLGFTGAMGKAAQPLQTRLPADTAVSAEVDLVNSPENGYYLQARLRVSLPGIEYSTAQALVDLAHQTCPYSKATRGNIEVAISVV